MFRNTALTHRPPSAAYMRQWTGSALGQVMACRLVGPKPLPEPMLAICYLHSNKLKWNSIRNSVIFDEKTAFEIVVCQNGGHFIQEDMS